MRARGAGGFSGLLDRGRRQHTEPRGPGVALAGLHLLVLWSFVAVQPLLDLLGDTPEFFVARQNTRGDIVVLAFALMLVPPALATAVEAAARRISPSAQRGLHLALVGLLLAALALQAIRSIGGAAAVPIALAVMIGVAGAVAYARTRLVPTVLTVLAPAPFVFVFVFLVISPVSGLVFGGDEAAAADVEVPGKTPVVMIVFDELSVPALMGPDRRIDAARLPSFGRLARDATWYRNATSVSDFTDRAVPAMLTGERPGRGGLPTSSDNPESLFTFLGRSHDLHVSEPVTDLCPRRLCPAEAANRAPAGERLGELVSDLSVVSLHLLLPGDLRRDLPPIDRSFGDFGEDIADGGRQPVVQHDTASRQEQFEAFFRGLGRRSRKPTLSFLHLVLPHNPYEHLPDGRRYAGGLAGLDGAGDKPGGTWRNDPELVLQGLERYLLQVGYTDRLLGRILTRLRDAGLYDRSLIVVAADHGVSFAPGLPSRAVESANFEGIASVPLLIKAPGQRRGRIDDANVSAVDILPTVAALLDTRLPWPVDGVPAGRRGAGSPVVMQPRVGEGRSALPFAEFVRRRDAAAARMSAEFRLGDPTPERRTPPDADLVERQVASLPLAAREQGRVELDRADALRSVDPGGDTVPFVLTGRLSDEQPGERLAVAVNGRVATVVRPFERNGERRFSALAAPERFSRGANRVEVVRVTGAGAKRRLSLLNTGDVDARLVRDGDAEAIVEPGGRRIAIGPGVEGFVDRTRGSARLVVFEGWAADTQSRRPAERVIAFSGDRLIASVRPDLPRPDLVKAYGPRLAKAGFQLGGATTRAEDGSPTPELRVFAVLDGQASPIEGVKPPTGGSNRLPLAPPASLPGMPGGAAQLKQAMRDVETALVQLRRAADEASSGQPTQPGDPSQPGEPSQPGDPSQPGEPGGLAEAERRLADLLQEASTRLGTATSAALSDQGRRVVRLRRARDTANPSHAGSINRTAEAGGAAVAGGAAFTDTGAPPAQRGGSRLLFAPSVIAVGIVGTLLVSFAVNAGIDPFRGQRLTPPPAAADGTGSGAPAIALPPVQAAAQPRVRAPAGEARRGWTESERRRAAKRATSRRSRAPSVDR